MRGESNNGFLSSNRFFLFKGLVFCLVAVTGWLLINMRNLQEFLDTYYARNQEIEQIELLKQRIGTLEKQQRSLRYNGIEAEKRIRETWLMHKRDEKVIVLRSEDQPAPVLMPSPEPRKVVTTETEAAANEAPPKKRGGKSSSRSSESADKARSPSSETRSDTRRASSTPKPARTAQKTPTAN